MNNPSLSQVSYDASTGILNVTGSNLINGIIVGRLVLQINGVGGLILDGNNDVLSHFTSTGFQVTLGASHKKLINAYYNVSGTADSNHHAYSLGAGIGWDNNSGQFFNNIPLTVTSANSLGLKVALANSTVNDTGIVNPFYRVIVTDSNSSAIDSATISFTAANGTLSGNGLSTAVINNGLATYTLSAVNVSTLQQELSNLVFTPTAHQAAAGTTVNTAFTITVADSVNAIPLATITDSSTQVTVTETAIPPTLTGISYDASSGILTVTGAHLISGIQVGKFMFQVGSHNLILDTNRDLVSNLSSTGFTITLCAAHQTFLNNVFNLNGSTDGTQQSYSLLASSGWDGSNSLAITNSQTISVNVTHSNSIILGGLTSNATLADTGTVHPFGHITVTDSNPNSNELASVSFTAANGILTGNGLSVVSISNGVATYTLSATSATGLQQALQALVFNPTLHQVAGGQTVNTNFSLTVTDNFSSVISSTPNQTISNFGVDSPQALTTDSQGNVWVTQSNNTLNEYSASGTFIQTLTQSNGLSNPVTMTTDSLGNLWVSNQGNNTVEEFSASGVLVHLLTASNGLSTPNDLVTDSLGNLWIANQGTSTIEEFSASGVLLHTLTQQTPNRLSTDSQGNLWVGNSDHSVTEFSASGVLISSLPSIIAISPQSQATNSQGIYWDISRINHWDPRNSDYKNVLNEYSATGSLINTIYFFSFDPSRYAVATDNQGNAWVTDQKNSSIQEYSVTGYLLQTLKSDNPSNIIIDSRNNRWVYCQDVNGYQYLVEYSANGEILQTYPNLIKNLTDVTTDLKGNLWGIDTINDQVNGVYRSYLVELSASGQLMSLSNIGSNRSVNDLVISNQGNVFVSSNSIFDNPGWSISEYSPSTGTFSNIERYSNTWTFNNSNRPIISTDNQGHLLAFNPSTNTVDEFSSSGVLIHSIPSELKPVSITTDHQGNVFVANTGYRDIFREGVFNGSVDEFSASGVLLQIISTGNNPVSLITDNQNHLIVVDNNTNGLGKIEEFSASGSLLWQNNISDCFCVSVDNQGNIFALTSDGTLDEYSSSGTLLLGLAVFDYIPINYFTSNNLPIDVATDSQGNVWVAGSVNNTVEKFSNTGTLLTTLTSVNGISHADGLVTDRLGDLYIANYDNNTVEEFSASGMLLHTLSAGISNPSQLVIDSFGDVFVANRNSSVEVFSASGTLLQTLTNGITDPISITIDNQGNLLVANSGSSQIEKFYATVSSTVTYNTTQVSVTDTINQTTVTPNNSVGNATVIQSAHAGDKVVIPDAVKFISNSVTTANVIAAGGDITTLSAWVNGALSAAGANEASHSIDWFNFNGSTYLVEQAGNQGSAYGVGDSLVQLVGVFNESHASFSGHSLTLA